MTLYKRVLLLGLFLLMLGAASASAVEFKVSRDALERTLKQQLFSGANGRYYLKGNAQSACYVYAEDAKLSFSGDRVIVVIKAHAKLGKTFHNSCFGISLDTSPEVSVSPVGEGEIIGFRDARLDKLVDQKELNFFLTPFLSHQLPASMQVNASDLMRKALEGSTASSGYKVALEKLQIHSMQIHGDFLVVDADGDISIK